VSKVSKTAKASTVTAPKETATITDEQYVKNLRDDLAQHIHVTQEGARALLRSYDAAVAENKGLYAKVAELEAKGVSDGTEQV
jgi:hypothetical protein